MQQKDFDVSKYIFGKKEPAGENGNKFAEPVMKRKGKNEFGQKQPEAGYAEYLAYAQMQLDKRMKLLGVKDDEYKNKEVYSPDGEKNIVMDLFYIKYPGEKNPHLDYPRGYNILYTDWNGKVYPWKDSQGNENFVHRTRFAPNLEALKWNDKKQQYEKHKYSAPKGCPIKPYFTGLWQYFPDVTDFEYICITEGEFKAWKACKAGIPCIGIDGIFQFGLSVSKDGLTKKEAAAKGLTFRKTGVRLLNEFAEFFKISKIENIIFLHDADCLQYSKDGSSQRQADFFRSVSNFRRALIDAELYEKYSIYYSHINTRFAETAKGLDDLIVFLENQQPSSNQFFNRTVEDLKTEFKKHSPITKTAKKLSSEEGPLIEFLNLKSTNDNKLKKYFDVARDKGLDQNELEEFISQNYETRYNTFVQSVEYRKSPTENWQIMEDRPAAEMLRQATKHGLKTSQRAIDSLILSEFSRDFDPIKHYFDNLPEWNGSTDYITQYCKYHTLNITPGNDYEKEFERFCTYWKKWFVGAAACGYYGIENHIAMVIQGGLQGQGKSKAMKHICPPELEEYLYIGEVSTKDKDSKIEIIQNFLIIDEEMAGMRKAEMNALKSLMTKRDFKVRMPYGRRSHKYIRRGSFLVNTNDDEILNDETGNRRFLVFSVDTIDYQNVMKMDIDNVWAQAFALHKQGYRHWFNQEEIKELEKHNKRFYWVSQIDSLLMKYFEPCEPDDPDAKIAQSTDIAAEIAKLYEAEHSEPYPVQIGGETVERYRTTLKLNPDTKFVNSLGKSLKKNDFTQLRKRLNGSKHPVQCYLYKRLMKNQDEKAEPAEQYEAPF
jgi:hypothetical protein